METFEATAQAGVAQGAIASTIAGKLIYHVRDLGSLLVDVDLPGETEVFAGELVASQDWGQGAHFERGGGVISRNIVGRVRPLGIAGCGYGKDCQTQNPAAAYQVLHGNSH